MESPNSENGGKKIFKKNNSDDVGVGEGEDRLSSFLECLLVEILSLLPKKDAVATSVLSKRWCHLWTQSARFEVYPDSNDYDFTAIEAIFNQLTSPKIHVFILNWSEDDCILPLTDQQMESVTSCFRRVFLREVKNIKIMIGDIVVPSSFFLCSSLETLDIWTYAYIQCELPPCNANMISVRLPNLKRLKLVTLSDDNRMLITTLFRSCPLLEYLDLDLELCEDDHFLDISSLNLKSLIIHVYQYSNHGTKIRIDAPNLVELDVHDHGTSHHIFVKKPTKLVNGKLRVLGENRHNTSKFLSGVSNVTSLEFHSRITDIFKYLNNMDDGVLPIFPNLTSLVTNFVEPSSLQDLMQSLHCFPKLEFLRVHSRDYIRAQELDIHWCPPESRPGCLAGSLKKLKIGPISGRDSELKFVEYILRNGAVLEHLVVCVHCQNEGGKDKLWKEYRFVAALFKVRRRSLICEIKFCGDYIRASGNALEDDRLACQILFPGRQ